MAEPMKIMYAISKCPRYILPRADLREPGNLMTVLKILMRDQCKQKRLVAWGRVSFFRKRIVKDVLKIGLGVVLSRQPWRGSVWK